MRDLAPYRPIKDFGGLPPIRKDFAGATGSEIVVKDGASFGQGVPAFWFSRAIEINGNETLYRPFADSVWVSAAVKQVSGPISSIGVEISAASAASKTQRQKLRWKKPGSPPLNSSAIAEWLNEPSPGLGWEDFVQASIGFLKMSECFWILHDEDMAPFPDARGNSGTLPKIKFARPDRMRPIVESGELIGWQFTPTNGTPEFLPSNQVIRLFNWNPYDDFRGLGELQAASIAAESDWMAGKFSRNLMANNGDLGGIIVAKTGIPTDPQREQIVSQLREKRAAQLRGELRYLFMTGDIDVKDPKITSVDAPFISQRIENRHEIATAFGVPMSMFDVKASYSIGSASDYYRLIMDTCIPAGAKLCMAVERFIKVATGKIVQCSLDWDEHPVMQEVRRERLAAADGLFAKGMPMKDISEYLGLELPKYEGWDIGYLPINLSPVGAEEVQDTTGPQDFSEAPPADDDDDGTADADPDADPAKPDPTPDPVKQMLSMLRKGLGKKSPLRKKALWEHHMRQRVGSVRMYQSRASKVINEFRASALRKLNSAVAAGKSAGGLRTKSLIDIIFNATEFGKTLNAQMDPIAKTVLQTAGADVFNEIGEPDDAWEMAPRDVLEYLKQRHAPIAGTGDTIRDQINTQLSAGTEAGETMDQLTDRVRGVFNNCSRYEAKRIAMTETCAAYGFGRHQAMLDAGVEFKSWVSSHGPNVRAAHEAAEDQYESDPIPVEEPFEVGGEALMFPGDPDGSPGNVINCQCIQIAVRAPKGKDL